MSTTYTITPVREVSSLMRLRKAAERAGIGVAAFESGIACGDIPLKIIRIAHAKFVQNLDFEQWLANVGVQQ